jgi:hypothetical protein
MSRLWTTFRSDLSLAFGAAPCFDQAATAGSVRVGRPLVPTTLPKYHDGRESRALLSARARVLRVDRAIARTLSKDRSNATKRCLAARARANEAGVRPARHWCSAWSGATAKSERCRLPHAIAPRSCARSKPGALYYTDEWHAYATLKLRGNHVRICKEKGRPAGRGHINGIEGFCSYAKNWLYPYRGVSRQYFHLYLGEICYRFNHRDEDLKLLF